MNTIVIRLLCDSEITKKKYWGDGSPVPRDRRVNIFSFLASSCYYSNLPISMLEYSAA